MWWPTSMSVSMACVVVHCFFSSFSKREAGEDEDDQVEQGQPDERTLPVDQKTTATAAAPPPTTSSRTSACLVISPRVGSRPEAGLQERVSETTWLTSPRRCRREEDRYRPLTERAADPERRHHEKRATRRPASGRAAPGRARARWPACAAATVVSTCRLPASSHPTYLSSPAASSRRRDRRLIAARPTRTQSDCRRRRRRRCRRGRSRCRPCRSSTTQTDDESGDDAADQEAAETDEVPAADRVLCAGSDHHRSPPERLPSLVRRGACRPRSRARHRRYRGPERAHGCLTAVDGVARHGAHSSGRGWSLARCAAVPTDPEPSNGVLGGVGRAACEI